MNEATLKMQQQQLILIVEDNEDDYEAVLRAFKNAQLHNPVFRCKTGDEALAYLKQEGVYDGSKTFDRPTLILLDLNMPGIDGRKTLQHIKKDENLKRIPVVIFTTSNSDFDIDACYQAGANTYIQKPVSFAGLVEAMQQLKHYWFKIALLPTSELTAKST